MNAITEADVDRSIEITQTHLEKAAEQIVWQIKNEVWAIKGYESWDEMREAVYGGVAVIVPRADRPELVARLRALDLSQQQIGDTLGVSQKTVDRDLDGNSHLTNTEQPASRVDSLGRERPTSYTTRSRESDENDPQVVEARHRELITKSVLSSLSSLAMHIKTADGRANVCHLFDAEAATQLGHPVTSDELREFGENLIALSEEWS